MALSALKEKLEFDGSAVEIGDLGPARPYFTQSSGPSEVDKLPAQLKGEFEVVASIINALLSERDE
jgi:hypothetical protein